MTCTNEGRFRNGVATYVKPSVPLKLQRVFNFPRNGVAFSRTHAPQPQHHLSSTINPRAGGYFRHLSKNDCKIFSQIFRHSRKKYLLCNENYQQHSKKNFNKMKKKNILSLAVIVAALTFAMPSQAQIKFGVKAGLNIDQVNLKDLPANVKKDNRTGFFAGVTADVTIPLAGLGADASLLYDNKVIGIEESISDTEAQKTLHYISLPINVKYTIGFSSLASVYVATGPQFSWNVGDRHWALNKELGQGWELNSSEFSWNVGAGATVLKHVRVGYNYNIGIGNTAETTFFKTADKAVKGKLKNNTHQISLTYLF